MRIYSTGLSISFIFSLIFLFLNFDKEVLAHTGHTSEHPTAVLQVTPPAQPTSYIQFSVGQEVAFSASAQAVSGSTLRELAIHRAPAGREEDSEQTWIVISSTSCSGSTCSVSGAWTPTQEDAQGSSYWVIFATARDTNGTQCTGFVGTAGPVDPWRSTVSGTLYHFCGDGSYVKGPPLASSTTAPASGDASEEGGFCGIRERELVVFTSKLFGCGISLVGGIALLFIIYGGFVLVTSAGDPSRVQLGKEYVTYAIIGLVMAIFTIIILEIVGFDILQLPGFGQ